MPTGITLKEGMGSEMILFYCMESEPTARYIQECMRDETVF